MAPASFGEGQKLEQMQLEMQRWQADGLSLQERAGVRPMGLLAKVYRFVGAAESHCGFVHLCVWETSTVERVEGADLGPCVFARVDFGQGRVLDVAAVHFAPSREGARAFVDEKMSRSIV
jgi:ribulose 1,5-bisphosphate carboxylase large subunit-like protein